MLDKFVLKMDVQTKFHVNKNNKITGISKDDKIIKRLYVYQPKPCQACGKLFNPMSSAQKYCCADCRQYSDQEHGRERIRRWRKKYKEVLSWFTYTTLGTGNLGEHMLDDPLEEEKKVHNEMKKYGLL